MHPHYTRIHPNGISTIPVWTKENVCNKGVAGNPFLVWTGLKFLCSSWVIYTIFWYVSLSPGNAGREISSVGQSQNNAVV